MVGSMNNYRLVPTIKSRLIGLLGFLVLAIYGYAFAIYGPDKLGQLGSIAGAAGVFAIVLSRQGMVKRRVETNPKHQGIVSFLYVVDFVGLGLILGGGVFGFMAEHYPHEPLPRIKYSIISGAMIFAGMVLRLTCYIAYTKCLKAPEVVTDFSDKG